MVSLQVAFVAVALSGVGQTTLLDFYSDSWRAACRAMDPTVQALVAKGYPVQRINRDKNPELAAKFGVQRIPCFIMVVDGQVVDRVVGGTTYSRLEKMYKMKPPAPLPNPPPTMLAESKPSPVQPAFHTAPIPQPLPMSQPAQAASISDAALLAVSVRLKIEDPDGWSSGSGTLIDARGNEALVLTCGHIFRDSQGKGRINVDMWGSNGVQQVAGRLISYDLNRDVGLVAIPISGPVATVRLAPPGYRVVPGMPIASVGCNNGATPTVIRSQVASQFRLEKYLGPPTIQVAGQPIQGRSGGGLFSSEGYVIGVCNAADPSDKEGLFASLESIYAELDQRDMAYIYKSPNANLTPGPEALRTESFASNPLPKMPDRMPGTADAATFNAPLAAVAGAPEKLPPHEQAALEEIHRRLKDGSEVVCIIRPRGNPDAKSEVIMLDRASPEFVKQIASEGRRTDMIYKTSQGLPKPRKILLEWTAPPKSNAQ